MGYVGNEPDANYTAFAQQTITGNGGTSYTLSHAVASGKEILLYINNVKQEEGSGKAYEATGTALTLSEAISSSDSCYCVFLGKALQTTVPPDGSVTSDKLDTNIQADTLYNKTRDNASGLDLSTNDVVAVKIAGSEKARVDSSGRLLIGTTTEGLADGDDLTVSNSGSVGITIRSTDSGQNNLYFSDATSGAGEYAGYVTYEHSSNAMRIGTNGTERIRINTSGEVFIGKTGEVSTQDGFHFKQTGECIVGRGSNDTVFVFQDINSSGATVGSISITSSNTAYNTSSDYRLKENVTTSWDATTRLKQLKPSRFNFKIDKDKTVDGFLAHEVSSIVPEAITGEKDAVDKDGNIKPQAIDQSKLVPLLVKTIQELEARIKKLEEK